jgi:uncharacterized membrane protein (UPF0127 family)
MLKPLIFITLLTTTISAGLMIDEKLWFNNYEVTYRELEGKKYKLIVSDTAQKREQGLMFRPWLLGYDGMEFRFSEPNIQSFWNKNTWMDLKLVFLLDDKLINSDYLRKLDTVVLTYSSINNSNIVVELK